MIYLFIAFLVMEYLFMALLEVLKMAADPFVAKDYKKGIVF